jgi:hypothetical protein
MKQAIPESAIAQVRLDDREVCEIRWCRQCDRGQKTIIPGRPPCPSCKGEHVIVTVRQEP